MDEISHFLQVTRDDEFFHLYYIALITGLRKGELFGLCWDMVDFKNETIRIERARDRYGLSRKLKTPNSRRNIPMNPKSKIKEYLLELREEGRHPSYVFTHKNGKLPDFTHFTSRYLRKVVEKAGLEVINLKGMRTTYASNYAMAGGDIYALYKLMGHQDYKTTIKKYAHLSPAYLHRESSVLSFESYSEESGPILAQKNLKLLK